MFNGHSALSCLTTDQSSVHVRLLESQQIYISLGLGSSCTIPGSGLHECCHGHWSCWEDGTNIVFFFSLSLYLETSFLFLSKSFSCLDEEEPCEFHGIVFSASKFELDCSWETLFVFSAWKFEQACLRLFIFSAWNLFEEGGLNKRLWSEIQLGVWTCLRGCAWDWSLTCACNLNAD